MRDQVEPAQRIDLLLALGQAQARSDENIKAKRTFEQAADVAILAYHPQGVTHRTAIHPLTHPRRPRG